MNIDRKASWMSRLFWLTVLAASLIFLYYWFFLKANKSGQRLHVTMTGAVQTESVLQTPKPVSRVLDAPPARTAPSSDNPKPEELLR